MEEANTLASKLLNVGSPHLVGKPLHLYLQDRATYFALLERVRTAHEATAVLHVRPRDRKLVIVRLRITALVQQLRFCWLLEQMDFAEVVQPAAIPEESAYEVSGVR